MPRWFPPAAIAGIVLAVGIAIAVRPQSDVPMAWARFNTQDVHSLAFPDGTPDRLLFGHHGGVLESVDGGRPWHSLGAGADAMSMAPGSDGSIVIAGHLVFSASRDGGTSWAPIATDLPDLDIHGFTRDPGDPSRMWAYLASGGLWESVDDGAHFTRVRADNVVFPVATRRGNELRLLGVDQSGLAVSNDGGRRWATLSAPPITPVVALAATPDGAVIYVGGLDGLVRSGDGGQTWVWTGYRGSAFAVATTPDGRGVAVVNRATELFRSFDSGSTWPGS